MSTADPTHNGAFAKALLAAQAAMPAVEPDATNPHFKSRFVSLGYLIAKVRPVLNEHGLTFSQFPSADENGRPTLVTILMHESGERMEYAAPLLLPKQDPQGFGSALTYYKRYALAAALGISDQEDDDGNGASPPNNGSSPAPIQQGITDKQAEELFNAANAAGLTGQRLSMWLTSQEVAHAEINSKGTALAALVNLRPDQYDAAIQFMSDELDRATAGASK